MEEKKHFIEPLLERAEEYGKTSIELIKLKAVDKTAGVASSFVSNGIVVLFLLIFLVIVNIGLGFWLGDLLGKVYYGFFCVAGFYALLALVSYFFLGNWIKKSVGNSIISQLLS